MFTFFFSKILIIKYKKGRHKKVVIGRIFLTYFFLFYDPWWFYLLKWRKWKKMKKEEMEGKKWNFFKEKEKP
jgi:hypothetical protein